MKSYKLFWNVLKRTGAVKLLCGYLLVFAAVAFAIVIIEPNINTGAYFRIFNSYNCGGSGRNYKLLFRVGKA